MLFKHDCDRCLHLRSDEEADYYFCPGSTRSWIARYSDEPSDYISRPDFPYSELDAGLAEQMGVPVKRWYRAYGYIYATFPGVGLEVLEESAEVFSTDPIGDGLKALRTRVNDHVVIAKVVRLDRSVTDWGNSGGGSRYHEEHFTRTQIFRHLVPEDPNKSDQELLKEARDGN